MYHALVDIIGSFNSVPIRAKKGEDIDLTEAQAERLLRSGAIVKLLDIEVELEEEPEAPKPKKRGRKKKDN